MAFRFAGTMEKVAKEKLGGLLKHNDREYENNTNKDIDPNKKHLNVNMIKSKSKDEILKYIEEKKTSKRATRKDAVLVNEWIISDMALQDESGDYVLDEQGEKQYYLKNLNEADKEKYFKVCTAYFANKFGFENLAYAKVHNDEVNTHMHLAVIPMKDGKLSSKAVFNRQTLLEVQKELPELLQRQGFNIERGMEGNKRTKFTDKEYKSLQDEKNTIKKALEQEQQLQENDKKQRDKMNAALEFEKQKLAEDRERFEKEKQLHESAMYKLVIDTIKEQMTKKSVAISEHNLQATVFSKMFNKNPPTKNTTTKKTPTKNNTPYF